MSDSFSPEFRQELLDDFYAECDELLGQAKAVLSTLESGVENGPAAPASIEELFRHVHSLKGISAIVGLRVAEDLAHAMEDVLRRLTKQEFALDLAGVDILLAALQRLEQTVTFHRLGRPAPEIADITAGLRRLLATSAASKTETPSLPTTGLAVPSAPTPPSEGASASDQPRWHFTFSPSTELDARGINVNQVRERLRGLGEILKSTPKVAGKSITFEFEVAVENPPTDLTAWAADGLQGGPMETPKPVAAATPIAASGVETSEMLSLTPSHLVRVDLARLDDLMRITGEMIIHRFRLETRLAQRQIVSDGLNEISLAMGRSLRELREAISRTRLVSISELFTRMPFVVRELVRDSKKKVRVVLEGRQTEIDKYLVERLKEPLLHLVRNAFSHGIESAEERLAAGKSPEAQITLRATELGDSVIIQVRDDGRGINPDAIAARAASLGVSVPPRLDAAGVLGILCAPGFSTREEADLASGRGVGMAVVANTVRELGGTLALEYWAGQGTQFTLRLPLSLSIADAIIVAVGPETCAIPQGGVDEVLQIPAQEVRTIQQTEVVPYRGGLLPIVRLRALFRLAPQSATAISLLVVHSERGATGLVVDRIQAQREIVIRPLADPLLRVPGITGATELGDGRPILILDPIALTNGVVRPIDGADFSSIASAAKAS